MRKLWLFCISVFCSFSLLAQDEDPTIIRIQDWEIPLSEFMSVYSKNAKAEGEIDQQAVKEYLDLYLNFKLKVYHAKEMGLDTNPEFIRELRGYRNQLAKPYLTDNEVTEFLIDQAYERMQSEVRAQHILIRLPETPSPRDTLEAFNEIMKIRKEISGGLDFTEAALKYSEDPSVSKNDGDLGFFSALYMVYPFENAAYNAEIGEVSEPVRTRFGYHLVKVTGKRPDQGEVLVAHIMIRPEKKNNPESIELARDKANEIYAKLMEGADFTEMVKAYSEDRGSLPKNGELPWFGTNVMVESFEEAAFALEEKGDISRPVKTEFGFHIIKLIDRKGIKPLEEIRYELKQKIEKDSRSSLSRTKLIKSLKDEYGYKKYSSRVKALASYLDESYYSGQWKADEAMKLNKVVFTIGDSTYTQKDFARYLFVQQVRTGNRMPFDLVVHRKFKEFEEEKIIDYENALLEEKYPRFKNLMREYHEGILLFEISDQMVWSKASADTAGLMDYYESIKSKFMWPERVDAVVVTCQNAKSAKKARRYLKKGKSLEWINAKLNQNSQLNFSYEQDLYAKGDNKWVDSMPWTETVSEVKEDGENYKVVYIRENLEPAPKELKEIRGIVISEYQAVLEKQWVEKLRSTYTWETYPELIDAL